MTLRLFEKNQTRLAFDLQAVKCFLLTREHKKNLFSETFHLIFSLHQT